MTSFKTGYVSIQSRRPVPYDKTTDQYWKTEKGLKILDSDPSTASDRVDKKNSRLSANWIRAF